MDLGTETKSKWDQVTEVDGSDDAGLDGSGFGVRALGWWGNRSLALPKEARKQTKGGKRIDNEGSRELKEVWRRRLM